MTQEYEMSEKTLRDEFALCEQENTNLRRHLLWAAKFMSLEQRKELAARLRNPIDKGGVVGDCAADERQEELERDKVIDDLTDHIQIAVERGANAIWIARADVLANRLRGFLNKEKPLTFHELKNP